ncbi:DnaJ subfamily A member 4 [Thelohanellus kitauei]|uniref:DnaJ subfamily A member 4 n=1 Tax=Thelohanellus kitauei TaxID=669202 RepID=A0A0C2MGQ0_THEKT|nr:DnaJ subfamily A member 4 [Thelohanellus kitauei]
MSDEAPDAETGDLVFVFAEKNHPDYVRQGDDLIREVDITLAEALGGMSRSILTLDKRSLHLHSDPGDVIADGSVRSINDEGMPRRRSPYERGLLIIKFNVKYPDPYWIDSASISKLVAMLPKPPRVSIPNDATEVKLEPYVINESRREHQESNYDDDEHFHPGRGAQCQAG